MPPNPPSLPNPAIPREHLAAITAAVAAVLRARGQRAGQLLAITPIDHPRASPWLALGRRMVMQSHSPHAIHDTAHRPRRPR
jgi:hypothetical protein